MGFPSIMLNERHIDGSEYLTCIQFIYAEHSVIRECCRHFFQGVHMLLSFGSSKDGIGEAWKPGERRKNRLVFIGRNLNRSELERKFKSCIVSA